MKRMFDWITSRLPSNCWLWSKGKQWKHGGYIARRRTVRHMFGGRVRGWWSHYLWARDLNGPWMGYLPKKDEDHKVTRIGLPALLFFGVVKEEKPGHVARYLDEHELVALPPLGDQEKG
jgi:hypothetical protein